jgi:aminoglycoside phosphotransferase (APT) family kinase protein
VVQRDPDTDIERMALWIVHHISELREPLDFQQIVGGQSNLTYAVTDGNGRRLVVRRPPKSHVLPTAHDMAREHRVLSALNGTSVPVPSVLGICDDLDVIGQNFFVMDFVDGLVLRDAATAQQLSPDDRHHAATAMTDALALIHALDPDAVGLGSLGRRGGYLERQLSRWYTQFNASKSREVSLVDDVHAFLVDQMPEQTSVAITHGDYRLENLILSSRGDVLAVLDWELCTLGDPLADVGLMLAYWYEPEDIPLFSETPPASAIPGFPTRQELAAAYAVRSGADLSQLDYYISFGFWKLACIADGVFTRYASGAMGEGQSFAGGIDPVPRLARKAKDAADYYLARS